MSNCPAKITIVDNDGNEFECPGRVYFNGKILCVHNEQRLLVDPEWYYKKDPKRLMVYKVGKWSMFRIKSVFLDSKAVRKTGINTR